MYLADVKFKRHKVVHNQPSELWLNNSFLNQMSQANSIKIQTQKTTSFLQKKRDGFIGEDVVKSDFKGKNISRLLRQSTWPTCQKGGYFYTVDNPYPVNIWIRNCPVDSAIPHQFNNRGLLAATDFCRNFSKNMLNRNCLQKSKIKNRKSNKEFHWNKKLHR